MSLLLKNAYVYGIGGFSSGDVLVPGDVVDKTLDLSGKYIFPGFTDVHVHLREPGFSYKETIASGTAAAARGGFTTVFAMPNLVPPPDSADNLAVQLDIIERTALVRVLPYGTITEGSCGLRLSDMESMPQAIAFTDDGRGTTPEILEAALRRAGKLGRVICSHCEDVSLKGGDHIARSPVARAYGIQGISKESEYVQLGRELDALRRSGGAYHMCHISCEESVELIRNAKREGLNVSCETAPHYIALDWTDIKENDGRFKMNPPLRSPRDREAIIAGLCDGTIDMIATDHAPHSAKEKGGGLEGSLMGVVGLETAFAVCYTSLVKTGIISLDKLIHLMSAAPRERFGLPPCDITRDFTVFDLDSTCRAEPESFQSMGRSTPFAGAEVTGECLMTVLGGRIIYMKEKVR